LIVDHRDGTLDAPDFLHDFFARLSGELRIEAFERFAQPANQYHMTRSELS
jgi:hypothetical protein